jgi:CYTH domain-containing protein
MAKEIERKFLLAKGASIPIPLRFSKKKIQQGYIFAEKDKQVRVRITKLEHLKISSAEVCIKFTGKLIRDEFEFSVTRDIKEAKALYKKCKWTIEKKRLTFASHATKGVHYDVDSFPNGMQWIEVEFNSIKDMKKWEKNKPHWIGEEITGVSKYSNITLAKKKLKF